MDTEVIYIGRDNTVDMILKSDGSAVDLSDVYSIRAYFSGTTVVSSDYANGPIKWQNGSLTGWDLGEIRLDVGSEGITAGYHDVEIETYDISNIRGLIWGSIPIEVKQVE